MPTSKEYLKWAKESGFVIGRIRGYPESYDTVEAPYPNFYENIEALCDRVWNEAIEAAAFKVDHGADRPDIAEAIRKLKQGETK